jgi:hypothetical protein
MYIPFLGLHQRVCFSTRFLPSLCVRHYWVLLLSNLYIIRILMRNFLRETFQD